MKTTTQLVSILPLFACVSLVSAGDCEAEGPCVEIAELARTASLAEAEADLAEGLARAATQPDPKDRMETEEEAMAEYKEAQELIPEQYAARICVCEDLGEKYYDPDVDPNDYLSPEEIAKNPNPYLPLIPGSVRTYEVETEEGLEVIRVKVTDDVREVEGVDCMVVRDTVWLDGVVIEDTYDWYTQDEDGNVWYFGELSLEFEDGELNGIPGSWEADVETAQAGIIMFDTPVAGTVYRQEFWLNEAEDMGVVLNLGLTVEIGIGTFEDCLETGDYTPIEPDGFENKFYAPGIGLILETKPDKEERLELISINAECVADINGSGEVDTEDLLGVLAAWGPRPSCIPQIPADINDDCVVSVEDILSVLSSWNGCS